MKESDLDLVLTWRNHPKVRRFMYSQHEISVEEHANWFARVSQDPSMHILVFEVNRTPLGYINIVQIAIRGVADWGFYLAPDAPKGTGRALGQAGLRYAFETAGITKLCGQALAHNQRSIRFHLNLGFQREGVLRQHHFDGQAHHDVVCFGLFARDWYRAN